MTRPGNHLDRYIRDRAWRACAVCAPPTVEPRTPPKREWAVGGANLAPPAYRLSRPPGVVC
jgi:hypothetical protein